jgi:hypothetical protein
VFEKCHSLIAVLPYPKFDAMDTKIRKIWLTTGTISKNGKFILQKGCDFVKNGGKTAFW